MTGQRLSLPDLDRWQNATINTSMDFRSGSLRPVHCALLLIVLIVALATHLYKLGHLPYGLWYDEAYYAMDATWVAETHALQIFFPGNNGREPLMPYLGALSMELLGETPYALRLVSVLVAVLTVALLYRWLVVMFVDEPNRHWVGLIAAGGFAFSLWYLVMSRTGHRAALVPACFVLVAWFFWRAWWRSHLGGLRRGWPYWTLAGAMLGLSQYSYLSARLLPLVFVLFTGAVTLLPSRSTHSNQGLTASASSRVTPWAGLGVMIFCAALLAAPLGLYFSQHPGMFFARSEDVSALNQIALGTITWPQQILDAIRVFWGGSDPHWRHNIADRSSLSIAEIIGFWIGLLVSVRRVRKPAYCFLLISLLVLWLPALLSVPAIYTLRLSGMLPIYYTIMAIGWVTIIRALGTLGACWRQRTITYSVREEIKPLATLILLVILAITAISGYFITWAQTPMVYSQYNGPLVDLADYIARQSDDKEVLLPLHVYLHPTMHFLLRTRFPEVGTLPELRSDRSAILVQVPDLFLIPGVTTINHQSSLMWLTRDNAQRGAAYLLHLARPGDIDVLKPIGEPEELVVGPTKDKVATLITYPSLAPLLRTVLDVISVPVHYDWGHQIVLTGYQVSPVSASPGDAVTLNLYWRGITDQPSEYRTFIHLLDGHGTTIGQLDGISLSEEQRWRAQKLSPEQHTMRLPDTAAAGAYLFRIGLIDEHSFERLPIYASGGTLIGDHLELGLFYVTRNGHDPRVPDVPLRATFGGKITILGYSLPECAAVSSHLLCVRLHWQALHTMGQNYTVFVHLLDTKGQRVTGYDSQPLGGLYPTSRWRLDEVIVDDFNLALPDELAAGTYQLVTGLYDLASMQRLPVAAENAATTKDNALLLRELQLPE